jgi:hypothetical protein
MNYETFQEYVRVKCLYDAIYQDQEGRDILVIPLLNAYAMVHRAPRPWVRLTDKEIEECWDGDLTPYQMQCIREIESRLREKNA